MNHGITNSKSDVYFSKGSTIFKPREASSRHVVTLTCWNTLLPWTTNTKTKLHNNHQSDLKISGPHITCSVVRASGHTSSQRAWMMGGSVSVQTASGKLCASYSYSEIMHISRMYDTYCRLGSMEALLPKRSTKTNMHFLWTVEDNVVKGHRDNLKRGKTWKHFNSHRHDILLVHFPKWSIKWLLMSSYQASHLFQLPSVSPKCLWKWRAHMSIKQPWTLSNSMKTILKILSAIKSLWTWEIYRHAGWSRKNNSQKSEEISPLGTAL